jgi:hypothetical protein
MVPHCDSATAEMNWRAAPCDRGDRCGARPARRLGTRNKRNNGQ